MRPPWSGNEPHRGKKLWDRARELARLGKTDAEIAKELNLPELNIKAMTAVVRERKADPFKKFVEDKD